MDDDWKDIAAGAGLTAGLLLFEHLTLWELRARLPYLVRYTLGTLAIGAGVTYASPRTARAFWPIAFAGGGVVTAAHLARRLQMQPADRIEERTRNAIRRAAPELN